MIRTWPSDGEVEILGIIVAEQLRCQFTAGRAAVWRFWNGLAR